MCLSSLDPTGFADEPPQFWSLWAVFFSFFSPLGLQVFLKFVADRKSQDSAAERTPTHVAVFYVALMAAGQVMNSVPAFLDCTMIDRP